MPPCVRGDRGVGIGPFVPSDLDLLLVVESSTTIGAHQAALNAELPRLFEILTRGDLDLDGAPEFAGFDSLHVGVVTTDLGSGPIDGVPTCQPGLGDGAVMRSRGAGGTSGCFTTYPSNVFEFRGGSGESISSFSTEVGCVGAVGTVGCGFEQPLEAALRALSPRVASPSNAIGYEPPRFSDEQGVPDSVAGNADGANAGFLRAGSVLAVLVLTDEDDCSVIDHGLLDAADPRFADAHLDVRCPRFASDPSIEHAIDRYVRGLAGLRVDPSLVVYGAIVAVPPELEPIRDVSAALDDARSRQVENDAGDRRVLSCISERGGGHAPVRLLEVAQGLDALGVRVSVSSICGASLAPAIDDFAAAVARTVPFGCLPRALPTRADGLRDCDLYELSARGVDCDETRGRTLEETLTDDDEMPRALCRVRQVRLDEGAAGWFYDDGIEADDLCGATPQRLAFSDGEEPLPGTELRLACADFVTDDEVGHDPWCDRDNGRVFPCRVGMVCDLADDRCGTGYLVCDPVHSVCAIPCASDDDCREREATLVCDLRSLGALGVGLDEGRPRGICLSPTCGP